MPGKPERALRREEYDTYAQILAARLTSEGRRNALGPRRPRFFESFA